MFNRKIQFRVPVVGALLFALGLGCGEGSVTLDGTFAPKIVVQGYLYPQQPVQVLLMRNFPIGATIKGDDIPLRDARATITDVATGQVYDLRYNQATQYYISSALEVEYGKSYTLTVETTIDGQPLTASSTTTVPQQGFTVLEEKSILDSLFYRQRDEHNEITNFQVTFERSPGTTFYAISITSLDADTTTFIYDNPFDNVDAEDVLKDFNDYKYNYSWIQDTPLEPGASKIDIFSFFTWFYGDYEAVVFAGDRNFRDFLISHENVQEIDGNFHEPALHVEGDGLGVFGSAIADTVYFRVRRP